MSALDRIKGAVALSANRHDLGDRIVALAATEPGDTDDDPKSLALAVEATLDEACEAFASVDITSLPAQVQQGIALVIAAENTADELLEAMGIADPDEASGSDNEPMGSYGL